jgi:hypothetical protein
MPFGFFINNLSQEPRCGGNASFGRLDGGADANSKSATILWDFRSPKKLVKAAGVSSLTTSLEIHILQDAFVRPLCLRLLHASGVPPPQQPTLYRMTRSGDF